MRNGGIWYDWWSVLQIGVRDADTASASKDMLLAVESTPAYVSESNLFIVVAPPLPHDDTEKVCDFLTWLERGWGRVVNITSQSVRAPIAVLGLSNSARTGLTGYVAGTARQVAGKGVTINNLLPGIHATEVIVEGLRNLVKETSQRALHCF